MNLVEAAALLTYASAFDNRNVTPETAQAWTDALDPRMTITDAKQIIATHYRDSRDWIMPADINAHNRRLRDRRLAGAGHPQVPSELGTQQTLAYVRTWQKLVADGAPPEDADRLAASQLGITAQALPPGPPPPKVLEALIAFERKIPSPPAD